MNNKMNENYIIAELIIKKDDINKDIRIINSFENYKKEKKMKDQENDYEFKNEKEIKEKCQIIINNKKLNFNYYNKFQKVGKYEIKYIFNENIEKASFMFFECNNLINIDLSDFNTRNITNMRSMFNGCISLKELDLSNFNTINVTNMNYMFRECNSLVNINLTNFKTQNVINMSNMFNRCNSLAYIDLSNFILIMSQISMVCSMDVIL